MHAKPFLNIFYLCMAVSVAEAIRAKLAYKQFCCLNLAKVKSQKSFKIGYSKSPWLMISKHSLFAFLLLLWELSYIM